MAKEDSKYCGCLYFSANALGRVMTRMAEEEFAITGLAPSYALLLIGVNEKPGIQPKELSEHMQLAPSTVTRLIEKLEHKGMVERKTNGRATEVYPTPKSLEMDKQLKVAWKDLHTRYTDLIGKEDAQKLTSEVYQASKKLGG
jgi:DNA-binding MarR family transcriptional regulator